MVLWYIIAKASEVTNAVAQFFKEKPRKNTQALTQRL